VKQALVDVYSAECARLQTEVKRLSVISSDDSQHQQQQQQPSVSRDSSTAAVNVHKISQVFISDLSHIQTVSCLCQFKNAVEVDSSDLVSEPWFSI